ncbi:MAG: aminotransferase class I/II-fold pyridoxal phosphate-dependent enzyme, partial [Clostridiales Family XIII bacterium]|nr:aminotransferase class I/II-fold pyridoxal phosphate-dependent enzyme [Clostridiales Family XIII bacterium]
KAGEQPKREGVIKLNANENPYPPAPGVAEAIRGIPAEDLRKYPQADDLDLRRALALYHGLDVESVFAANGSDEAIALAFRSFFNSKKPILFPGVTYSFYPVWCGLFGVPYRLVPLAKDFRICVEDYAAENGGVVLANPNAPTGLGLSLDEVEQLLALNPDAVVIVDEAYVDFGCASCIGLIAEHENLLVVQTFSKGRALAGIRLGAAFGSPALISVLNAVKNAFNSYPVDRVAAAAGIASLADEAYFKMRAGQVAATRERTAASLREMGFFVTDSLANFLFVSREGTDAAALQAYAKERGILVRHFALPETERFLRISVGTDAEMDRLLEIFSGY